MASNARILTSLLAMLFLFSGSSAEVTEDSMAVEYTTLITASTDVATDIVTEVVTMAMDMTTAAAGTTAVDVTTAAATTAAESLTTVASASDIEAYGLSVTSPSNLIFDLDVDNIVTYSVVVRNAGGTDIAARSSGDNFALTFLISSHSDPTDVDASTVEFVAETSSAENLAAGITAGSTITITGTNAMINIPSATCSTYQYTCVQVSKASGASYDDSVTSNNYYCLAFGDTAENLAGLVPCSGCTLKVSILLLLVAMVASQLLS
ncbi:uncharacterized protein LOC110979935 [Acanthaster planci]|uniref:Uncharacterized protein LOC110979935 n=1 Tax=Acanthaster planci TaxID=133434 RepID=A0A8B7YEZ8_ACAPL|nr:uncharacterized protein LOC110979935 [Acanthaster planci]